MSVLTVKNLSCQKAYNTLFNDVSFQLNAGNILRITGANGSGKTSLLKIVAGLSTPETGLIDLDGSPYKSDEYQQQVLYLGHLPILSFELSALENLEYLSRLKQSTTNQALMNALSQIGLKGFEFDSTSTLSAGQKRRVILAELFLSKAKVWLLDEPFTALDAHGISVVESCIKRHSDTGGICLLTTHQDFALKPQKILAL